MPNSMEPEVETYKGFLFWGSIRESVEALPTELGDKLLRAVMVYGTEGVIRETDPAILCILQPIIDRMERCRKKRPKKEQET